MKHMERLTDRARLALKHAQEEALRLKNGWIGTEHILLGLVREGQSVAVAALRKLGVDVQRLPEQVESRLQKGIELEGSGLPALTDRAKQAIELALEEAGALGHDYIGTEHILLGLLREGGGLAARVLQGLGVSLEATRNEVQALLGATSGEQRMALSADRKKDTKRSPRPPMTARQRILGALRGEIVDHVPLCAYPGLFPRGEVERQLRNEGMGIFHRVGVVNAETPNVITTTVTYEREGRRYTRNTLRTPVGEVSETIRHGGGYGSSLRCEFFIKEPKDYKVMQFIVNDTKYSPAYEAFREAERTLGEDGVAIGNLGYTPMMQMLIMWMGPDQFAVDYYEHPDEFFALYEALCKRHEEQYEIAANSPAEFIIYGDNVTAKMIGLERFQKYVAPCYNKLADALHAKGKKVGSHLDGDLRLLKDAIRESKLDFIEAYNPPPDGDLPIKEARAAWGQKVIAINFTSSIHLARPEEIEAHTRQLLKESYPGTGFLVGVTENIPEHVWQMSLPIINRVLREHGRLPFKW